jgi:hypothetical protein
MADDHTVLTGAADFVFAGQVDLAELESP